MAMGEQVEVEERCAVGCVVWPQIALGGCGGELGCQSR